MRLRKALVVTEARQRAIQAVAQLASDVGIPARLHDIGVKEADIPTLAEAA